jgi:hypothetical protein
LKKQKQNLPDKEVQLNSAGINRELKGWLSHDAWQHICTDYNMTYHG